MIATPVAFSFGGRKGVSVGMSVGSFPIALGAPAGQRMIGVSVDALIVDAQTANENSTDNRRNPERINFLIRIAPPDLIVSPSIQLMAEGMRSVNAMGRNYIRFVMRTQVHDESDQVIVWRFIECIAVYKC
jgi:hypothetical protein